MRFVCEWCYSKVPIKDKTAPYGEVIAHFQLCERRSPKLTVASVSALAEHIASLVSETDEDITVRVRRRVSPQAAIADKPGHGTL